MKTYRIYKLETASGVDYRVGNDINDQNIRNGSHWIGKVTAINKLDAIQILKSAVNDVVSAKFGI